MWSLMWEHLKSLFLENIFQKIPICDDYICDDYICDDYMYLNL